MDKLRLLIIGCGSIGRRHALNASALGVEVHLCDKDQDRMNRIAVESEIAECHIDYHDAVKRYAFDAAIIATPTHLHLESAFFLAETGVAILMEKPLAASLERTADLAALVRKKNIVFMMGHCYRFRTEWIMVKQLIDAGAVGRVYSAELSGGWYLPDWHIHEDYRKEYAGKARQGGGVMLTSMSHFFDIVQWLFGDIVEVSGWKSRVGTLDIDVDDIVSCSLQSADGAIIHIMEDFLSRFPRREIRISGSNGMIDADFSRKSIRLWTVDGRRFLPAECQDPQLRSRLHFILEDGVGYDPEPQLIPFPLELNAPYLEEMRYFLHLVASHTVDSPLNINAGVKVMEMLESSGISNINCSATKSPADYIGVHK